MFRNRKGFTTVELVIVIAVIAILATVLIPTFSGLVGRANDSKALQEAKNAHTEYLIENGGTAPEYMLYQSGDRFVALHNGTPKGVYSNRKDALKAIVGENADISLLTDSGDGKIFIYGGISDAPTDWSGASAFFVGDSISDPSTNYTTKFYYNYLQELIGLSGIGVDGKAGACISDDCTNTSVASLYDRYKNIPSNQDLIVIFMGTNDYGHAAELGDKNSTDPNNFYGSLNTVIPYLQKTHPYSQIVIMTPLHRDGFKSGGMYDGQTGEGAANKKGLKLLDYVNALRTTCDKYGIPVIDLYNLCTLNPADKTYFRDGLHPNTAGHEVLAKIIAEELKKIPHKKSDSFGETVDSEFVNGNKFARGYEGNTHSATLKVNLWLAKNTVVEIKDNAAYEWALAPANSENEWSITSGKSYYPDGQWTTKKSYEINEDGWYGFIIKIRGGTTGVDYLNIVGKKLTDFFNIINPV